MSIAICESYGNKWEARNYFRGVSNVELTIALLDEFNETTAEEYFGILAEKITTEGLTEITFQTTNDFFPSDEKRGVYCEQMNKNLSGFNYKLKLPKKLDSAQDLQMHVNENVLNLDALKVKQFKAVLFATTAHAMITEDKVLLLSKVQASEFAMVAELVSIDTTQSCPENKLDVTLLKPFAEWHQINLMFAD